MKNRRSAALPHPERYFLEQGLVLSGKGEWATALCPFHPDARPSLRVHRGKGCFRCMSCGAKGANILAFHCLKYDLPRSAAARELAVSGVAR